MIYFLQIVGGPIKIGFTKRSPEIRLEEEVNRFNGILEVLDIKGIHVKMRVLGYMPGDRMVEQTLHRRFAKYSYNNKEDWFHSVKELYQYIRTMCVEFSSMCYV